MDYVIQSAEHQSWWADGGCGYVQGVKRAGLYSKKQATAICKNANQYCKNGQVDEVMIPVKNCDI